MTDTSSVCGVAQSDFQTAVVYSILGEGGQVW